MSNLKKRVSLILSIVMLALAVFPLTISTATSSTKDVEMSVKLNGRELEYKGTYDVKAGDQIVVKAKSTNGASIAKIGYFYYEDGTDTLVDNQNKDTVTITVPTQKPGTKKSLLIEAVASNNTGKNDPTNRTNWQIYYLVWPDNAEVNNGEVNAKYKGSVLAPESTTTAKIGDVINLYATPADRVTTLYYAWDNETTMKVSSSEYDLEIPENFKEGQTYALRVIALYDNGNYSEQKKYNIKIASSSSEVIDKEINAKYKNNVLAVESTTTVEIGDVINLYATPSDKVKTIYFAWGNDPTLKVSSSKYDLKITDDFKAGETYILRIRALYNDEEYSEQKKYYIKVAGSNIDSSDDELEVLPWEKENKDLDSLAVALRNDSESKKKNKNIYALNEEVTYYVDYKNGGKDIDGNVVLKLELPLKYKVIDADGGVIDSDKSTITWTFNGMEEDQEGTKVVKIKYTGFDKKSDEYETVYPLATIAKDTKVVDKSAVINLIYEDEDTVIDDAHVPYMYGDRDTPTFRPNDTITRAEGALVLTRILLGQRAIDNVTVKSVYPDLDETYEEAQKAIIAATSYGIINGYTDGYYRPNTTMTRAEFMKILAKFIEINADDEGIDGLEIKDLDRSVKIYKDLMPRYVVNNTELTNHWAIEEVTLLTRLNMTGAKENKDLRLDENITRAEVAQLVNFFTFRAPAETNSRTTSKFTDVNRYHELFGDIIEATRAAHEYSYTEDGTEKAE